MAYQSIIVRSYQEFDGDGVSLSGGHYKGPPLVTSEYLEYIRNGCGLVYPKCGRSFRLRALCLAKIEPFYWPTDCCNAVIGSVK